MGKMFGVGEVMAKVQADQNIFVTFDDSKPAPPLIKKRPGGGGGKGGGASDDGC